LRYLVIWSHLAIKHLATPATPLELLGPPRRLLARRRSISPRSLTRPGPRATDLCALTASCTPLLDLCALTTFTLRPGPLRVAGVGRTAPRRHRLFCNNSAFLNAYWCTSGGPLRVDGVLYTAPGPLRADDINATAWSPLATLLLPHCRTAARAWFVYGSICVACPVLRHPG
jgi:hypothetical protein